MSDEKKLDGSNATASHAISYPPPSEDQRHGSVTNAALTQRDVENDITYTKDVHSEKREIPESNSMTSNGQKKNDKDEEAGENLPSRSWRRYRPWLKHVIYAVIWLLFTG
jgi:CNT family concentrative nucleoside transporter